MKNSKIVVTVDDETVEFQVIPKLNPVILASPKDPFRPKKLPLPEWILVGNSSSHSATLEDPASRLDVRSYSSVELSTLWRQKGRT